MYDVALSVAACVRAGTRADVAWMVAPTARTEAVMLTPGGGRIGSLAGGAFDSLLVETASRQLPRGRRVRHQVEAWESEVSDLEAGSHVEFLVLPADQLPLDLWPALIARDPVAITAQLESDDVVDVHLTMADAADAALREAFMADHTSVEIDGDQIRTVFVPVTSLVVAGRGPIADALAAHGSLLGWKVLIEGRPDMVEGLTASLSSKDAVVVMGHDVESSSRCLQVALESNAGYVGALGSLAMQRSRADWLAYRDVTDLSRVHGPAGLDIGAKSADEVAISIIAQIIQSRRL